MGLCDTEVIRMPRPCELEAAFVLHRAPYGETSLRVELFAEGSGRLGAVARGGRRPRRGTAALEPFRPFRVHWSGGGELRTLRGWEPGGASVALRGQALYLGFYLNELLLRLCARFDPYPRVFAAYRETLAALAEGGQDRALRLFEAGLLRELGLAPDWDRCGACQSPIIPEEYYAWEPEMGLTCHACARKERAFSGRAIGALKSEEELGWPERREARDLMRVAMAPYLGSRPLASRALLRSAARLNRAESKGQSSP